VEAFDLRFGTPPGGTFTAVAILDSEQRVLDSWFSFRGGRR
jgi:hypothetical protein